MKTIHGFSKVVQIILLVIPFVNWIVEMYMRWTEYLEKKEVLQLVVAIICTFFFGTILGWIDALYFALTDQFILE